MKCRTHLLCVTQWQSSSDLNKRIYVTDAITAFSCGFFPSSKIFWIIPGMYLNFYLRCGTNVTRNAYCLVNLIFYRIVVIKLNSSAAVVKLRHTCSENLWSAALCRVDLTLLFGSHWRAIHTSYPYLLLVRGLILPREKSTAHSLCCLYALLADKYLVGESEPLWMNKVLQGEIRLQVIGTLPFYVSQRRLHMQPRHRSSAIALSWGDLTHVRTDRPLCYSPLLTGKMGARSGLVTPCILVRMCSKILC